MQDQIGKRFRVARSKLPGRSLDPIGNGWARGMIAIPMRIGIQNSAYRLALNLHGVTRVFVRTACSGVVGVQLAFLRSPYQWRIAKAFSLELTFPMI